MKKLLGMNVAVVLCATMVLSACGHNGEVTISQPIYVDGCEVKYVDSGRISTSFYIAKCDNTTTISHTDNSGKFLTPKATVVRQGAK